MENNISVIIPVYNAEKTLQKCVYSVVTCLDRCLREIILVNDGSVDSSDKICDQLADANPLLRVFHQNNSGVSTARNIGLQNATGEWVMFIDADDLLVSSPLMDMDDLSNQINVIYYAQSTLDQDKSYLTNREQLSLAILRKDSIYNNISSLLFSACSKLYRRMFLINNKIFFVPQIRNGEDMIFNLSCVNAGARFLWINREIYHYIKNEYSATHIYNRQMIENDKAFLKHLRELNLHIAEETLDEITVNGLFLVIRKALAHKDNPKVFSQKRKQVSEICMLSPYRNALKRWTFFNATENLPKRIVLLLCKMKFYGIAVFIASL